MQILTNSYEIKLPLLWIFLKMLLFSGVMNNMSQMLSIEHVSKAEHLKLLYTFFFRSRPVCIYFPRRYVASQQVSESKRMDSWFPLLFLRSESNFSHLRFVQFGFSQLILITLHTHTRWVYAPVFSFHQLQRYWLFCFSLLPLLLTLSTCGFNTINAK